MPSLFEVIPHAIGAGVVDDQSLGNDRDNTRRRNDTPSGSISLSQIRYRNWVAQTLSIEALSESKSELFPIPAFCS